MQHYKIVRELGRGAFGTVYEAITTSIPGKRNHIAIKIVQFPLISSMLTERYPNQPSIPVQGVVALQER
jgi:serine/threonine protein kinase